MEKVLKRFITKAYASGVLGPVLRKQSRTIFKKHIMTKTELLAKLLNIDPTLALTLIERYADRIDMKELVLYAVRLADRTMLELLSNVTPLSKYQDEILDVVVRLEQKHMDLMIELGVLVAEIAWKLNTYLDTEFAEGAKLLNSLLEKKK